MDERNSKVRKRRETKRKKKKRRTREVKYHFRKPMLHLRRPSRGPRQSTLACLCLSLRLAICPYRQPRSTTVCQSRQSTAMTKARMRCTAGGEWSEGLTELTKKETESKTQRRYGAREWSLKTRRARFVARHVQVQHFLDGSCQLAMQSGLSSYQA